MNIDSLNRARNITLAALLAMGLTLPTAGIAYAADDDGDDTTTKVKDKLNNLFKDEAQDENAPKKTESVYIFANADGSVKNTVVTNWLKNVTEATKLHDISSLTDIQNTEGKETFEAKGESLVWDAQGSDIYYQGNTEKKAPVELKITYWLDGKETPAADMAGKNGHVKIRFDYKNNSTSTEYVAGAARTVYTPFVCVTGMMLDNGVFKNISTKNAKVLNDGDRTMVGGYALPGLQEDLDIDKDTVDLPTFFEIEADVENFEMGTTATIVSSNLLNNLNTDELDTSELGDALNELSDAMGQLIDGTSELYKGMDKLDEGGKKLADGTGELKDKTADLPKSAKQLADGSSDLADGAGALKDGTSQLASGSDTLAKGASNLTAGLGAAVDGTSALIAGNKQVTSGLEQLVNGTDTSTGLKDAVEGVNALKAGVDGDGTEENPGLTMGLQGVSAGLDAILNGTDENPGGLNGAVAVLKNVEIPDLSDAEANLQAAGTAAQNASDLSGAAATDIQSAISKLDETEDAEAIELLKKAQQEVGGAQQCDQGILKGLNAVDIPDTKSLKEQLSNLTDGLQAATNGLTTAETALNNKLIPGSQALSAGLDSLNNGGTTPDGRQSAGLNGAIKAINEQLIGGNNDITNGLNDLSSGLSSAKSGSDELSTGANTLAAGAQQVDSGAKALSSGAGQLASGLSALNKAVPTLTAGIKALAKGADQLSDGIGAAKEGTGKLKDGIQQLNDEGIQKIVDAYHDNLDGLSDRLKATVDAGKAYNTFTGKSDDMQGNVKFIFETDAIEIDDGEE